MSPNSDGNTIEAIFMDDIANPRVGRALRRFPYSAIDDVGELQPLPNELKSELCYSFGFCSAGLFQEFPVDSYMITVDGILRSLRNYELAAERTFELEASNYGFHLVTFEEQGGTLSSKQVVKLLKALQRKGYGSTVVCGDVSEADQSHQLWMMFRTFVPMLRPFVDQVGWICLCLNLLFSSDFLFYIGALIVVSGRSFIHCCSYTPMRNADPRIAGQCSLNAYKKQHRQLVYQVIPSYVDLGYFVSLISKDQHMLVDVVTFIPYQATFGEALHIEAGGSCPVKLMDVQKFLEAGYIPTPNGNVAVTPFTVVGAKNEFPVGIMIGIIIPYLTSTIVRAYHYLEMLYSIKSSEKFDSLDTTVPGQCCLNLWSPRFREYAASMLVKDPSWAMIFTSKAYIEAKEAGGLTPMFWVSRTNGIWHVTLDGHPNAYCLTPDLLEQFIKQKHGEFENVGRLHSMYRLPLQVIWVSIMCYGLLLDHNFCNIVVIFTLSAVVAYWLIVQPSKLSIRFMTFGSRGDIVPLQYYVMLMQASGLDAKLIEFDGLAGSEILRLTEEARYDQLIPHYTTFLASVKNQLNNGHVVFAPIMGYSHPRLMTYAVSPVPGSIDAFNLFPENHVFAFMNRLSTIAYELNSPIVRIGSFADCWPRSPDGTSLITEEANRGTRQVLVTMGSSNLEEPDDLPVETTWSTREDSKYKWEHRKNHAVIFADYQTIVCHGGAGTVATAKACGCNVVSVSSLLDRSVKNDYPFTFTQNVSMVHKDMAKNLPLNDALAYINSVKTASRSTHIWMVIILIWRIYIHLLSVARTVMISGYHVLRITGLERFDVHSLHRLFQGSVIGVHVSVVIVTVLKCLITGLQRKHGYHWLWRRIQPHIAPFLLYYTQQMGSLTMIVAQRMFGFAGGIIVHYVVCDRALFYDILLSQGNILFVAITARLSGWAFPEGPCVQVRFQPFQAYWLPWFIPAFHTEFVNPEIKMAAGITCEEQKCKFYHHSSDDKKRVSFTLPTMIPISHWDTLCGQLAQVDGNSYNPLNHCQTNAFRVMWNAGENSIAIITLSFTCVVAIFLLGFCGLFVVVPLLCLQWIGCSWSTLALDEFTPAIAFAGLQPFHVKTMRDILKFLFSPSTQLFEGPLTVAAPDQYPRVPVLGCSLLPSSGQLMRINVGGSGFDFWQPFIGMHRPNYKRCRMPGYSMIHSLDLSCDDRITDEQWSLVSELESKIPSNLPKYVAVVAVSGERELNPAHLSWLISKFSMVLVLTNDDREIPGCEVLKFMATGRELAALRLAMPARKDVTWFSFNSEYQGNASLGPAHLWSIKEHFEASNCDFVSVIPFGLHQCAAGIMAYKECVYKENDLNFEVYGSDEAAVIKLRGMIYTPLSQMTFTMIRKEMDFPCEREIYLYDPITGATLLHFGIRRWCIRDILPAIGLAKPPAGKTIALDANGFVVNGTPVNMAPLVSELYPTGTPVEDVLTDIQSNLGAFFTRIRKCAEGLMRDAKTTPVSRDLLASYDSTLRAFQRGDRPPKALWAPIQKQLKGLRSEELGINLHPNPTFVNADFDTTLMHYVSQLNGSIASSKNPRHRKDPLTPSQFRRRVNRNPYIDTYLQSSMPEAFDRGHDASAIACKEIMLASLARYNKSGFIDALTLNDVNEIVEVMFKRNPGLYAEASIADPAKLTRRFLKFKKYGAGIPFAYEGSGIKNRADLRKAGMLKPIVDAALLPFITGKWYPALAHSFPKSQVIPIDKIIANPAKMRSVVATSAINNVQQGVFNFDVNNRHDFMSSNEKVAMPLSGSHMVNIFSDLKDMKNLYSADVTAMDSVISDGVFKVIAGLRKKGFEDHPAFDVISKHIECAIEQTKHAYVINLIGDKLGEFEIPTEYQDISDETWNKIKDQSAQECFVEHPTAPGGVLKKQYGGSTGDSNVTFNNTKALPIILMYSFCKANNWDYAEFFDKVPLHNFGDDNLFGLNDENDLKGVIKIAAEDLGVTLRLESKGISIYDQQFLGRKPVPVEQYKHEFDIAGLPIPEFAIVNDTSTMKMRFANEKIESTRHKGANHEIYRLEKCLGYLNLCAHDREFYDQIVTYMEVVKGRLDPAITTAKWFKAKFKIPSYILVLQRWYKPIDLEHVMGIHSLSLRVGLLAKTESSLLRITRFLGMICDTFPAHLVVGGESETLRVSNVTSGIFEAHAWHCFVMENDRPPSLFELRGMISDSPFAAFSDAYQWLATVGATLPTRGPLFTRNRNHAIFRLLIYTAVYMNLNRMATNVASIPLGNVVLDLFNLVMFKSRNLFGTLGYSYYLGKGKSSPIISGLMPKDPYLYHKRAAIIVDQLLPKLSLLGIFPFGDMLDAAAICSEEFSRLFMTTMFNNVTPALQNITMNDTPWNNAITDALSFVSKGICPMITAHTGTGKTKYSPGLVLRNTIVPTTQVVVVMPRNIICEQWSATSGALFKKRNVKDTSELITCTYGYLAHCFAANHKWWNEDAFFLFDEAHEESVEWKYLRSKFVSSHHCMCLTATPLAKACSAYPRIVVDIEPPYEIDEVKYDGDMKDAISTFLPSAKRLVVIEPSLRKCKTYADMMKASGYPTKIVHSGDREIPDGVHIVATTVIEASITIPGADYIIDSGERLVNDGGLLVRVPNDHPGMIQRRGRTGRTNAGTYVSLCSPINRYYEPVPDITMLLAKHPISEGSSIKVPFEVNNGAIESRLEGDCYVRLTKPEANVNYRKSIALLHKIKMLTNREHDVRDTYISLVKGQAVDQYAYLQMLCGVENATDLCGFEECENLLIQTQPCYVINGHKAGGIPTISKWAVRLKDDPHNSMLSARVKGQLNTVRATTSSKIE